MWGLGCSIAGKEEGRERGEREIFLKGMSDESATKEGRRDLDSGRIFLAVLPRDQNSRLQKVRGQTEYKSIGAKYAKQASERRPSA